MGVTDLLKKAANIQEPEKKLEEAKFEQPCALCGKAPTEVKWMGQYWHKRCRRSARRSAYKMI